MQYPKTIHTKKNDPKCRVNGCTKKGQFENGICPICKTKISKAQKQKKAIKQVSDKRKKENTLYSCLRKQFLTDNPLCKVCGYKANEIHHKKGRENSLLIYVRYFLSVCRDCHTEIELNPLWAKENGYSINRTSNDNN